MTLKTIPIATAGLCTVAFFTPTIEKALLRKTVARWKNVWGWNQPARGHSFSRVGIS